MSVQLNAAVRIAPPSELNERWIAENILERRRFRISLEAAAALVASARPQESERLAERMADNDAKGRGRRFWQGVVEILQRRSLIVDSTSNETDPETSWLVGMRENWSRFGWHEAAEYHALTFDYPCLDYTEGAAAIAADQNLMRTFQRREPDTDRYKLDYVDRPGLTIPETTAELETATVREVWSGAPIDAKVDSENLMDVLSLGFGSTGIRIPVTDSAPLLRRSSPSGGGRHPSEAYLVVRDVPGLEPGWYHVTMQPFSLRRLPGGPVDDETLSREVFPETMPRFPFDIKALIVVTSVFERNMYRYREPRTFRTVHMDAGHIAGTLWMAARSKQLLAGVYLCDRADGIEQAIGVDPMREGYMLTVALADGPGAGKAQP